MHWKASSSDRARQLPFKFDHHKRENVYNCTEDFPARLRVHEEVKRLPKISPSFRSHGRDNLVTANDSGLESNLWKKEDHSSDSQNNVPISMQNIRNYALYLEKFLHLLRVNEQRNILHEISKRKANWISHILRRNCLLQRIIEGKIKGGIEMTGRRGRRRKKLLHDLKERRGYSHLKKEALVRTKWTARFGRGFGPVVRQTTKRMNDTEGGIADTCFGSPN